MRPRSSGYLFVAPYVVLLVVVGIYPVGYAIDLALTSFTGSLQRADELRRLLPQS